MAFISRFLGPKRPAPRSAVRGLVLPLALAGTCVADVVAAEPADTPTQDASRGVGLGAILETAVRQSPALELARIDVAIADARVLEAAGIDDWLFSASASWQSTRVEPVEGSVFQTTATDTASFDLDLSRNLPTGGTLGLHGRGELSRTTAVFEQEGEFVPSESEAVRGSVLARLDQPLLEGRGRKVARAGRRLAEVERSTAELGQRVEASRVVRELVQAYWELGYAQSELEIRQASLDLARERQRITEAAVDAGSVAPSETLAVEQVIAEREEAVEQAKLGVTQRSIELRRLAGMRVGPGEIDIPATAPLHVDERELPLRDLLARARASSPEIAVLRERGEGAEIEVEVTENGLLPRLDASVSFGPTGSSSSLSDTIDQIGKLDGYEIGGTLTYEHALGRREARGAHAAARGQLRRAKLNIAEAELQVSAAVAEAVRVAETASRRMDISQRAIDLAEENIEAETSRFELGRATNFDILERQDELRQAQLRYARAGVDYLAALAQIETLTGDLLESYGITLDART